MSICIDLSILKMDIELYIYVNKNRLFDFQVSCISAFVSAYWGYLLIWQMLWVSVFTCGIRAVLNTRTYGLTDANVA